MEISQAAKAKAVELANIYSQRPWQTQDFDAPGPVPMGFGVLFALARVLQEHSEAAKRVVEYCRSEGIGASPELREMILADDAPTPNTVLEASLERHGGLVNFASTVISALDAAGYQITRKPRP